MVFLLLGCVDPTLDAPDPLAVTPATWEALAATRDVELLGRAQLRSSGAIRFSDAGPAVNEPRDEDYFQAYRVVEADAGLRVVDDAGGLRLLLWLDRDEFWPLVAERAWVAQGERVPEGRAGVRVPVGAFVDLDDEGPFVELGWPLTGRVDVPGAMVDEWFDTHMSTPTPRRSVGGGMLAVDTPLFDEEGAEIARTIEDAPADVLAREGDRVLVEVEADRSCGRTGSTVRGWIEAARIDETALGGWGFGCCCCGGFGRGWGSIGPSVDLPPDRLLWDAPDGDVVGVVLGHGGEPATLRVDVDAGDLPGWVAVIAPSTPGDVTVWARTDGGTLDDLIPPEDLPEWATEAPELAGDDE